MGVHCLHLYSVQLFRHFGKFSRMRKAIALLFLALFVACTNREESRGTLQVGEMMIQDEQNGQEGCLVCVEDIMKAIADCQGEGIDILKCITESLGAASDCIHCICEILEIIGGYDGVCP